MLLRRRRGGETGHVFSRFRDLAKSGGVSHQRRPRVCSSLPVPGSSRSIEIFSEIWKWMRRTSCRPPSRWACRAPTRDGRRAARHDATRSKGRHPSKKRKKVSAFSTSFPGRACHATALLASARQWQVNPSPAGDTCGLQRGGASCPAGGPPTLLRTCARLSQPARQHRIRRLRMQKAITDAWGTPLRRLGCRPTSRDRTPPRC